VRIACVHCFTIEADDKPGSETILRDLQGKINAAAARLGIGYQPGFINGQLQPHLASRPTIDPEALFDSP